MDTIKLQVSLTLGTQGAVMTEVIDTGILAAEWNAMTPDAQERRGDAELTEWQANLIGGDWRRA